MKPIDKLGLYSHAMPAQRYIAHSYFYCRANNAPEEITKSMAGLMLLRAPLLEGDLQVFDCRELPLGFVWDTGGAAFDDYFASKEPMRLPYRNCYFELADKIGISAVEDSGLLPDTAPSIGLQGFYFRHAPVTEHLMHEENGRRVSQCVSPLYARLNANGKFSAGYFSGLDDTPSAMSEDERQESVLWAIMTVGVLELLKEKLVVSRLQPDPAPKLTLARGKQNRLPVSGASYRLQVNVPAIHTVARATPLGSHESPLLHWRRGHYRVLHRGGEFEKTIWVKKCLVGDPSKGYLHKTYRLTNLQPILPPQPAPHFMNENEETPA